MNKIVVFFLCIVLTTTLLGQPNHLKQQDKSKPFVLGLIDEIQSSELSEKRILNIYLPEGYDQNDAKKYPVIYLLDGSADEDFIHIVGLVQFNSFEWINQVPKSIVVGIATVDRRRDFTFPTSIKEDVTKYPTTGHSNRFIAFIEKDLQPYIDAKFKTNTDKTIIGQSLGGLLATEILFTKPFLFNRYIIVSPSLWWNNGSILNQPAKFFDASFNQQTAVYIGVGKEGLTPTAIPRVMEVDVNLLADKIRSAKNKSVKVYHDYLPQEDHATIMHQAVLNAFKLLYQTKQ
ncbi:MAG: alpha/beta hydrolase-fold protein [Bacteroidota bacterium]